MNICIGGDLDGKVVELNKKCFKAQEIEPDKKTEYYQQKYILDDRTYYFWLDLDLKLREATDRVEKILRSTK
nr:hypothetical protein [Acinetobacter sp. Marseille-Q1620]